MSEFEKLFSKELLKKDLDALKEQYLKAETKPEKDFYGRLMVYLNAYAYAAYQNWFNFTETSIVEVH